MSQDQFEFLLQHFNLKNSIGVGAYFDGVKTDGNEDTLLEADVFNRSRMKWDQESSEEEQKDNLEEEEISEEEETNDNATEKQLWFEKV